MTVTRRSFLKLGSLAPLAWILNPFNKVFGNTKTKSNWPDLVAIKDGSPAQMFEVGIKAIGGMERFVKKGQMVLIKPNIGWNKAPAEGANTRPDLVGKIIEHCLKAGAKQVVVFDNTCHRMEDCYKNSGIEDAVKAAGGTLLPSNKDEHYVKQTIKNGKTLDSIDVHKAFMDADVVINVPVLKSHSSTRMTAALKNSMVIIKDRQFWHSKGLHGPISEFWTLKKPDLTIIDAYSVMMKNGPLGISSDDLALKKMQLISTDMVLADTAASKILDLNPNDIDYLKISQDLGHGSMNIKKANIKKINIKG